MAANSSVNLVIGAALSATFLGTTGRAQSHITRLGESLARLRREQRSLTGGRLFGAGQGALVTKEVGQIMQQIDELEARKRRLEKSFERMSSGKEMMGSALKSIGALWAGSQLFLQPVQAASAFEDAMLGVAKQLDGARDAQGKLTPAFYEMREQVQALGRTIPMATKDIAEMTAAGLRMGVAKDEVLDFVKSSSMMAAAFEMPAGQLAEDMGKIAGVYKIPIREIDTLADAVNYLDDNAQSKGGDIINVLQRIGGVATMVGMSAKDAAALGSTFLSLGASAEVAATASNVMMRELSVAAHQPKRFHLGMEALGLKSREVQAAMAKDATGTIQMVLDKLNGLSEEKRLTVATQLFGKEFGDDAAKLAGNIEEYRRQLKLANSEKAKGSMKRESEARDQTMSAQWQLVKNQAQEAMVAIGDQLMPVAREGMKTIVDLLRDVSAFAKENSTLLQGVFRIASGVVRAFVAAKMAMFAFGAARYAIGSVASGWSMMRENLKRLGDALDENNRKTRDNISLLGRMGREARGVAADTNRVGRGLIGLVRRHPLMTLAALVAGGAYLIRRNWDSILAFFQENFPVIGGMLARVGEWFAGLGDSAVAMGGGVLTVAPMLMSLVPMLGGVGGQLRVLGKVFVSLGKLVMAHPLLRVVGLLAMAAIWVCNNWEPIKAFFAGVWDSVSARIGDGIEWTVTKFGELRAWLAGWVDAGVALFDSLRERVGRIFDWLGEKIDWVLGSVQKAGDWVGEKLAPVTAMRDKALGAVTDGLNWVGSWFGGDSKPAQPEAAARVLGVDASELAQLQQRMSRVTQHMQNTVTINVSQQPGESGEALAKRVAQAQERALAVRNRGGLYDPAVVY
ncbi:MAG: phage tail tape measure protein [Lautropia sp.]|nr:phage tail tape measure protein [Lautropia sp.]